MDVEPNVYSYTYTAPNAYEHYNKLESYLDNIQKSLACIAIGCYMNLLMTFCIII